MQRTRILAACMLIVLTQIAIGALAYSQWGEEAWAKAVRLCAMAAVLGGLEVALLRRQARLAQGPGWGWRGISVGLLLGGLLAAGNVLAASRGEVLAGPRYPFGPEEVEFLPAILIVSLLAPIVEEIFFRGILLGYIWERHGAAMGVIVSAAMFSLAHGEPGLMWQAGLGGLILGIGYVWTGSLATPILAHVMGNLSYVLVRHFGL